MESESNVYCTAALQVLLCASKNMYEAVSNNPSVLQGSTYPHKAECRPSRKVYSLTL